MKKFVVAFDGLRFSDSVKDYAIMLAKQSSAHLVGVFLDDTLRTSYRVHELVTGGGDIESRQRQLDRKDRAVREQAAENFQIACQSEDLSYSIHHDSNIALQELLHESIYADLLIIDNSETLSTYSEKIPGEFIRNLLSMVKCPVLIVPHHFKPIDSIVLLYDGEPSSVYAIKMFSYTLASMKQDPAEVITVKDRVDGLYVPDSRLMKEFMKRHFPKATYTVLNGQPDMVIADYLQKRQGNPLVVLGAYRRGFVSRWFHPSMADALMKDLQLPLFIAHDS
jgi:nucleotide-binding universal stress UspA family protein